MPAKPRSHATRAMLVSLAALLTFAVVALVASNGAQAAKQPKCGDTITTDTTLHHDLVNCPNNGLVIGADNVTLDLNGHLVDGDGTPAAGCDPNAEVCDSGVVDDGHDGITVMHGSVSEFGVGVLFGTSTAGKVRHNRVLGVSAARNEFVGLGIFSSARSLIRNSSGNGSTSHESSGIFLGDSHHVRLLNSSFRHNGEVGIHVADSTHDLIKGNPTSRNRLFGIILEKSERNQVRDNRSVRDGLGVLVALHSARRNVIARNRIIHPTQAGGGDGQGIEVPRGSHNVIARNSIRDASQNAIALGFEGVRAVGNVVRHNHIRSAGKDGVYIGGQAEHTLLRGNRVSHSKDDGLDVDGRTTKLTKNRAVRNHDLGMEAVKGVIDGGGNVARHNGDPRQCTNIVCN